MSLIQHKKDKKQKIMYFLARERTDIRSQKKERRLIMDIPIAVLYNREHLKKSGLKLAHILERKLSKENGYSLEEVCRKNPKCRLATFYSLRQITTMDDHTESDMLRCMSEMVKSPVMVPASDLHEKI